MKKILFTILAFLPLLMQGQCAFLDTLTLGPPWPNWEDTTAIQPSLCYTPSCGHGATVSAAIVPAFDGCIIIDGDEGWIDAVIYDSCNLVLLDTCFYVIPAAAVVGMICKSYPVPTILYLYRDTAAFVSAYVSINYGTGWPQMDTLVNTDTLCTPVALSIGRPIEQQQDQTPIDISTGRRVLFMEPNRVYSIGGKKQVRIE